MLRPVNFVTNATVTSETQSHMQPVDVLEDDGDDEDSDDDNEDDDVEEDDDDEDDDEEDNDDEEKDNDEDNEDDDVEEDDDDEDDDDDDTSSSSSAVYVYVLKFLVSDCCLLLGFHDQASELCHKCYSYQWNTESYAACWCSGGNVLGLVNIYVLDVDVSIELC